MAIGSFLAFASIANAQWSTSGTSIYKDPNNTGNVGIGTTSPVYPIDVRGYSTFGGGATSANYLVSPYSNERHLYITGNAAGGSNSYGSVVVGSNDTEGPNQWLGGLVFGQNMVGSGKPAGSATGLKAAIRGLSTGSGGSTGGYGGNLIFCTTADNSSSIVPERMRIDMNGNVGIGMISGGGRLEVSRPANQSGNATAANFFSQGTSTGDNRGIYAEASNANINQAAVFATTGGATQNVGVTISNNPSGTPANDWGIYCIGRTWCTLGVWSGSDQKIKDNIKPLENMMDKIKLLKPSKYEFRTTEFRGLNLPEGEQIGLIAQELEQVFPNMVSNSKGITQKNNKGEIVIDSPDLKSINYPNLIPVLISGIQEQQTQIENLSATINLQQKQLAEQKQMIDALINKAGTSTGMNEINSVPTGFSLEQNIPNPFNNETLIKYTMPSTVTNASLVVYDLSGKQVTSFPLTEKGTSSITITSEKLAAGIYIYSVMADGKIIDTKRMVVAQK